MNEFKISINKKFPAKRQFNNKEMELLGTLTTDNAAAVNHDNMKEFAEQVGSKGCSFCPATFKDGIKSKETFEQLQLLPLYFDSNDLTFEEVKAKADNYDLPVLFAFDAFSLGTRKKFSVVFLNNDSVSELRDAETTQKALMTIFPEADASCNDVTKLYHGGNKLLYYDYTVPEITIDSLFMSMSLYLKNKHGLSNYKRKIAEFSRTTGIALNDKKLPDISVVETPAERSKDKIDDKNLPIPIIIKPGFGEKLSSPSYQINYVDQGTKVPKVPVDKKKNSSHRSYRSNDLKSLGSCCKLFQEFESGSRLLLQPQLLGLATNLAQVESGKARFQTVLSDNSYFNAQPEKYDNWDYYFYYIKDKTPQSCASFCPHQHECPHGKTIFSTKKPKYHQMERIANYNEPLCSLEEAWDDFMRNFIKAVRSNKKIWHIIKAQTALGKTRAILKLLRDTGLRILIAVPTNALKREICERAAKMGIEIIASPSLHELEDYLPDNVWDDIAALYDMGKSPMSRLNKAIAEDDIECAKLFKQYIRELEEFNNADGHVITTHRRLTSMDLSKYDLVIVDEDIIYSTVIPSRDDISISSLEKLKKEIAASDPLAAKIRKILKQVKKDEFFTMKEIDYDRSYAGIKMAVNIPALCSAKHFCYRKASDTENDLKEDCVTFVNPVKFDKNTKYIMLSATVSEDICKYYFGEDKVEFYECLKAENIGGLNIYPGRSMSRFDMAKDIAIIKRIKKWSGFEDTISFKKFMAYYTGDLHFGNCAGCDYLKGKNLDIIGTPHQPKWIYELFAYSLERGIDVKQRLKPNTTVTHNGYRFRFNTYDDMELRAIQFYMIESQLEQAVGRARLLRCDCTVNLFANFPLSQATIMNNFDYDND